MADGVRPARARPGWEEWAMTLLRSYVGGAWVAPAGDGRPVFDAVTGEEVARVSSAGIDMAAALAYGRDSGGPALRALTFHQRTAQLRYLAPVQREAHCGRTPMA